MVAGALDQALRATWDEPPEVFAQRLTIEGLTGRLQRLDPLFFEQLEYLQALRRFKQVVAIKPRQVGFTTVSTLFLFAKAFRADHPRLVLQTTHSPDALQRVRRMLEVAYDNLPPQMQFGVRTNNERTEFMHNKAGFRRLVAGTRSQGRGWTYSDYHATEMAFYPSKTSSKKDSDTAVDADLFASIRAAMHDETGHIIVESTGDGPKGFFYSLASRAQAGMANTGFVFIPWTKVDRYVRPVPENFTPTPEEVSLMEAHGLTPAQVMFRRERLDMTAGDVIRFRREYPTNWLEPFLPSGTGWFDQDAVSVMATLCRAETLTASGEEQVWEDPIPGEQYFIGADTSGGVKRDEAVAHVIKGSDRSHVAMWASNRKGPEEQAEAWLHLAKRYNDALILCEKNRHGVLVNDRLREGGARLFYTDEGELWYAHGRTGGDSKREMMVYARRVVAELIARPRDAVTIAQIQFVVEKPNGAIQARGDDEHDDRAIAWCLAQWCARKYAPPVAMDLRRERADEMERAKRKLFDDLGIRS